MSAKKEVSAADAVLEYLRVQNRPYSVNDIVLNMHKEHGKTAVQKALDKLVADQKIREKCYGKQKIYLISQVGIPEATPEELKAMDKLIEDKEKLLKELEARMKEAQQELKAINSSMTTEEAKAEVEKLTKENKELEAKYEKFASSGAQPLEKEEREAIRTERSKMLSEWRLRKKLCMSMINGTLEGWPGTKEELFEQSGVATDEETGVKMPN